MVKFHLHYKHIAAAFVVLLCFAILTVTILHDIYSKKGITDTTVTTVIPDQNIPQENAFIYDLLENSEQIRYNNERDYAPKIDPRQIAKNPYSQRAADLSQEYLNSYTQDVENPTPPKIPDTVSRPAAIPSQKIIDSIPQSINPALQSSIEPSKLAVSADDSLDGLSRFVQAKLRDIPRTPRSNFYVAAVIDFQPSIVGDIGTKVRWNIDQYIEVIRECEKYTVDIVVFPENGIFAGIDDKESILNEAPQIPPVEANAVPCDRREYDETLTKLSCGAKHSSMYVSVTLMEKYCIENTACSRNDLLLYMTSIVFDRSGKIVARYRKYNLYVERWLLGVDQIPKAEFSVFTTDFNVTFGLIGCFDIFFKYPAVRLIQRYNVTDIIYPSGLPTRLPFLSASSLPAGWAYSMNVNLLSAKNSDIFGVAGNNIFFGRRESAQTYMSDCGFHTIVVAPVPKRGTPFPQNFADPFFTLSKYYNRKKHFTYLVEHVMTSIKMEPVFDKFTNYQKSYKSISADFYCNITMSWEPSKYTYGLPGYRMASYVGPTNYSISSLNNYVQMCGLMLCSSMTDRICLLPPTFEDTSKVTISSLKVIAAARAATTDVRIPITLSSNLTVLDPSYYYYRNFIKETAGQKYNIAEITLRKPVSNLVSFGIYKLPDKANPPASYSILDTVFNADTVFG